jgi:hypothetical protein
LPTEEDERADDEYASGGIIAFADEGQVRDPDSYKDPGFLSSTWGNVKGAYKYATDPAFRAFVENGGDKGDISVDAYRALGNDAPLNTEKVQVIKDQMAKDYTDNVNEMTPFQRTEDRPMLTPVGEGASNFYNKVLRPQGIDRTPPESTTPKDTPTGLYPYIDTGMFSQMPGGIASVAPSTSSSSVPQAVTTASQAQAQDIENGLSQQGVKSLPAAQNVQIAPGQRGASTAAPAGGEKLTPKVSLENAPSTLKDAEAQQNRSPAASQAISMLDKYVAMLEKSGEDVGREKKEALYMALISGGLAAAGGTSPNALANIAAGMVPATQQYQKVIAGIRKDDRERLEKLISAGIKKEEFALKAEEIGINRKKADQWYEVMMDRNSAMRDRAGTDKTSFLEQKHLEGMELKARQDVSRIQREMSKALGDNGTYNAYMAQLNKSDLDPKKRTEYQTYINNLKQPWLDQLKDAREYANIYSSRRRESTGETDTSGGPALPKGIPPGSRLAGKSGGKDVYAAPDGKQYIVD